MHLITLLAFACLFFRAETSGTWPVIGQDQILLSLSVAWVQPFLFGLLGYLASRRVLRWVQSDINANHLAQCNHHRSTSILRVLMLGGFGFSVLCTPWPDLVSLGGYHPFLQIVSDIVVIAPFILSSILLWIAAFPVERVFREGNIDAVSSVTDEMRTMRLLSFLDFNIRHQLLIVAVPMTLILFAADLTRSYDDLLRKMFGWVWAPDAVLSGVAVVIFVLSPLLLKRIWKTAPLEDGPLRQRLEQHCQKIGLRCRDILIWKSDGLMINAAVMGIFAPLRYVLLSDALLTTMDTKQIEAVFGHEAGHVHHRHIQQFLMLAFVGWMIVAGIMELLARVVTGSTLSVNLSMMTIEGVGIAATVVFWGLIFGWVSRRFERQADLFGAQCVAPTDGECTQPCGVHIHDDVVHDSSDRVCITGAEIFASALGRVAVMNGIPKEERSWRHSSIGSRMRFLMSLAGDANRTEQFNRVLRRIKITLMTCMIVGMTGCVIFWWMVSQPATLKIQAGGM